MARTPLRTYLKEIEMMIERGQVDEAAAHCRHILESYPKLVAAYRLMGKAFLEGKRYADAADLFQRVLSTVPDDFVAHVGMSIIREDEGNLDTAIWHMERAFEVQPYNAAIQGELRRLYGRRDGVEPPKVRLTRGALARMYARGNLYQQAITELRAGLAEDQQRPDLQVLLARMFFLSGAKVEAVETCSQLLNRLPYCLEANRTLAAILPETGRKDDAQAYAQRVQSLDPYLAQASPAAPSGDGVPEASVILERMEYTRGATGAKTPSQPAWAASLGVSVAPFTTKEEVLPDWLKELEKTSDEEGEQEAPPEELPEETPETPVLPELTSPETPDWLAEMAKAEEGTPAEEEAIPDWMKDAGWGAAREAADNAPQEYPAEEIEEATPGEETIAAAEIPDWLKAMAPEEIEEASTPEEEAAAAEALMPWLESSLPETPAPVEPETPEAVFAETELPSIIEAAAETEPQPEEPKAAAFEEIPDWLKGIGVAGAVAAAAADREEQPQAEEAAEIPDWLKEPPIVEETLPAEPSGEAPLAAPEVQAEEVEAAQPVSEPEAEYPDWLRVIDSEAEQSVEESSLPTEAAPEAAELSDEDAAIAWLESLAARQGVPEEELTTQPEERPAAPPEWVSAAEPEATVPAVEAEPAQEALPSEPIEWEAKAETVALEPVEAEVTEEEAPAPPIERPEWLPEEGAPTEEVEAFAAEVPGAELSELPDWLKALEQETIAEETPAVEEAPAESAEVESTEAAAAFAWLESLAAKQGVPEEELTTQPEERVETPPEWVAEAEVAEAAITEEKPASDALTETPVEALVEETPMEAPAEAEPVETAIPDWLEALAGEEAAGQTEETPLAEEPMTPTPVEAQVEAPAGTDRPEVASEVAALAWLESLAAKQGAPEEELTTRPEERSEEMPDWIQEMAAEPVETISEAEAAAKEEVPPAETTEEQLPDWLETLAKEDETVPEEVAEAPVEPAPEEEVELPEWMREPTREEEKEEIPWQPGPVEAPIVPARLLDINQASLVELEALPGVGFRLAQSILSYCQEHGPFSSLEDLLNVPNFTSELLEELRGMITVTKVEPPSPLVVEEELRSIDADQETLIRARNALMQEQIGQMTEYYSRLIKQERLLDEVIHDLHEALYRFPVEVGIWETLGDAYARCNQLQEALDAYTKAEELLR